MLALTGCDVSVPGESDPSRAIDAPPLRLIEVRATSTYTVEGPEFITLNEAAITEGVATSARFELSLDRFLLPHKVIRQSICLRPKSDPVESIDDCREPFQVFAEPEYDPVLRRVIYRLPADTRLESETYYRLTVFATPTIDESGLFAFDNAPLDRTYVYEFNTRPASDPAQNETLPTAQRYCEAVACFDQCQSAGNACTGACTGSEAEKEACVIACCNQSCELGALGPNERFGGNLKSCAFGGCHLAGSPESPSDAAGLDLSGPEALAATAINHVAHQTQQGGFAAVPAEAPLRFGRSMPLIDPGNPGNSYLLYKLITHPMNHAHTSGGAMSPELYSELLRLGAGAIMGLPMPISISGAPHGLVRTGIGATNDAEASQAAMQAISTWIAHGAVTSCSP